MEKDFIQRSLKTAIFITIISAPFLLIYFDTAVTLGFISGAAWNIVNVYLLYRAFSMIISPAASNENKILGGLAGILKFPVLYGTGYIIIGYTNVSLYGIIAGFSVILIVFILKASGILLLKDPASGGRIFRSIRK